MSCSFGRCKFELFLLLFSHKIFVMVSWFVFVSHEPPQEIYRYFPDAAVCGVKTPNSMGDDANKLKTPTHQLKEIQAALKVFAELLHWVPTLLLLDELICNVDVARSLPNTPLPNTHGHCFWINFGC